MALFNWEIELPCTISVVDLRSCIYIYMYCTYICAWFALEGIPKVRPRSKDVDLTSWCVRLVFKGSRSKSCSVIQHCIDSICSHSFD